MGPSTALVKKMEASERELKKGSIGPMQDPSVTGVQHEEGPIRGKGRTKKRRRVRKNRRN